MNLAQIVLSTIRTFVPWAMGFILPWLTSELGWTPSDVDVLVNLLVGGIYYFVMRLLERYVTPKFGWLLGAPVQPVYAQLDTSGAYKVTSLPTDNRFRQ